MAFHFHPNGNWAAINKEAARLFAPENEKADYRVYASAAHALLEFTLGFREQFPLKKKYFYFRDLDPHFALSATALAKAGLQVTGLNIWDFLKVSEEGPDVAVLNEEKVTEFVGSLDREFGFIFLPLDNPVTGQIFPFEFFEKALLSKSFAHLKITYGQHRFKGVKPTLDRNEAIVYAFSAADTQSGEPIAVTALGDRMRFGNPVAQALSPVSLENLKQAHAALKRAPQEQAVREFEAQLPVGAHRVFAEGKTSRLFDRAVFYFEDMDGHAFIDALAQQLDQPLQPAGCDSRFETTSLSRWGGIRTMDWLKVYGFSPEMIRGLVVIEAHVLTEGFLQKFIKAREQVLKLQNG